MKKLLAFILAMLLCVSFCFGCGSKAETEIETEPTENIETTESIEETVSVEETTEPIETTESIVEETTKPTTSSNKKPSTTKPSTTKPTTPKDETPTTTTPPETTIPQEPEATEPEINTPEESKEESNLVYLGNFRLTAYCNCSKCCDQWAGGPTATGTTPKQGRTIAVDPKVIPYGSKVMINGHTYIAEDCGGGIKNKKIDIYFDSHSECNQFGVQYADVYLVK